MISSICLEFFKQNKSTIYNFLIVSTLFYIVTVVIIPLIVSNINYVYENLKLKLCIVLILVIAVLAILVYFFKLKMETRLIPELTSYVRSNLVKLYLEKNKVNFEDSNITSDINTLYETSKKTIDFLLTIVQVIFPLIIISFF